MVFNDCMAQRLDYRVVLNDRVSRLKWTGNDMLVPGPGHRGIGLHGLLRRLSRQADVTLAP